MGATIIEIISNYVTITGNGTLDTILLGIIGLYSFSVAFGIVGKIFDFLGLYDSDLMSDLHWSIRVVVFIFLTWILTKIFQFFAWLFSFPWWVYVIAIAILIILVVAISLLVYYLRKRKYSKVIEEKTEDSPAIIINEKKTEQKNSKDYCPRCGALLVRRNGPYGRFWGCSNFPKTNCRYTRSFK